MKLIELYGIKIKELTEILKDERVRKSEQVTETKVWYE